MAVHLYHKFRNQAVVGLGIESEEYVLHTENRKSRDICDNRASDVTGAAVYRRAPTAIPETYWDPCHSPTKERVDPGVLQTPHRLVPRMGAELIQAVDAFPCGTAESSARTMESRDMGRMGVSQPE